MLRIIGIFLSLSIFISNAKALVLEDLIAQGKLAATFSSKKIGFYVGSFDPIHLGHEKLATTPIQQNLCDYVLVYPAWGGDSYKNRADTRYRHDMVFSVFKDHPTVIVTRLPPQEMQRQLTKPSMIKSPDGKPLVEPAFPEMKFIGIVGSDVAILMAKPDSAKALSAFMTGIEIPEKYHNHTLGGLMALPADSFIVSMRKGDDLSTLDNSIKDRPIIAVITSEAEIAISSTAVKNTLKQAQSIDSMVSAHVAKIIQDNELYKQTSCEE
jgi:nicotinic acid mononucleotide adenylyltransferase